MGANLNPKGNGLLTVFISVHGPMCVYASGVPVLFLSLEWKGEKCSPPVDVFDSANGRKMSMRCWLEYADSWCCLSSEPGKEALQTDGSFWMHGRQNCSGPLLSLLSFLLSFLCLHFSPVHAAAFLKYIWEDFEFHVRFGRCCGVLLCTNCFLTGKARLLNAPYHISHN